jgi:5-methylcytosine-specific restriction endonuclease McrA
MPRHRSNRKIKNFLIKNGEKNCFFCGQFMSQRTATVDHLYPLSKSDGGRHKATQCVLSCHNCNDKKSNRRPTKKEIKKFCSLLSIRLDYTQKEDNGTVFEIHHFFN